MNKPLFLCILDGWGYRKETKDNAIALANTPNWDHIIKKYPYSLLETSGLAVGLPEGQMGNSEVGHMNIGSGRIVMQDLPRIDQAILDKTLDDNKNIVYLIKSLKLLGGKCHLMGLLSDGGVHSHQNHILYLARLIASHDIEVNIHAFLDGRDTAQKSAIKYLSSLELAIKDMPNIKISTLTGRYFAMDRDNRWDRIEKTYNMIAKANVGEIYSDWNSCINKHYDDLVFDEFIEPSIIKGYQGISDGDAIIFANFRADRIRQIVEAFLDSEFNKFARKKINFVAAIGMVEYSDKISKYLPALFPATKLTNIFAEILEKEHKTQLRIAETEKYAHVTFFFSGGREQNFIGEDRILIPSPKVSTYDKQPEMSAEIVTDKIIENIKKQKYDVIIANFANPDMVGHSGIMEASIMAVETIDKMLGRMMKSILEVGGIMLITADHGNIEEMMDYENNQPNTAHTTNPVPFVFVASDTKIANIKLRDGRLCDIAPTMLEIMKINKPSEMTGNSLIKTI